MERKFRITNVINKLRENVAFFYTQEGTNFDKGDFVFFDTQKYMALKPRRTDARYVFVGKATRVVKNEHCSDEVICIDGVFSCKNHPDPFEAVTEADIGELCYFEDSHTLTRNSADRTVAGRVCVVQEDKVYFRLDIHEEDKEELLCDEDCDGTIDDTKEEELI